MVAEHDDPMVILVIMTNMEVKRVFINQGSSTDIIFGDAFDKLGLWNSDLHSYSEELIGFLGEKIHPDGFVTLYLTLGNRPLTRTIKFDFLVVVASFAYNLILGQLTLNKIGAIISIALLTMKFVTDKGKVEIVKVDQVTGRSCYNSSLETSKKRRKEESSK